MAAQTSKPLYAVLASLREQVIDRFAEEAARRQLAPPNTPRETFIDHVPDLVDEVIGLLQRGEPGDRLGTVGEVRSARAHAKVRWDAHYDLATMVREYGVLRDAIVDTAEKAGANITVRDYNILSNWITVGVAEAVNEYNRQREKILEIARAKAEQEAARLDTILRILPVGLVIADANAAIVRINEADDKLWAGASTRAERGERAAWSVRDGVRVETEQRGLWRSLVKGEIVTNEEMEIADERGVVKTLLVSSAPIRDPAGTIVGAVGVNVDITDTKAILRRLESAVSVREELVAVVSHDLRDPLGVIAGSVHLIDRMVSTAPVDAAAVKGKLAVIRRACSQMMRLISDLLDVQRIDEDKLPLDLEDISVQDLVSLARQEALAAAQEKSIDLRIEAQDPCQIIRADRNRILQVFANLLGNAIKFTPERGRITIGMDRLGPECRFFVRDTGPGIHEKQLPHVFDRFARQEGGVRTAGHGLGLTIAKGVVESHSGKIWVDSRIGQGTTVSFTLPGAG